MGAVENEVLLRLFSELGQAVEKLERLARTPRAEFLRSFEKLDSAKYNLVVAVEATIDICNHLIAERALGTPEDYADVFRIMGKTEVFDEAFVQRLVQMARFRNLLVHLYWRVEDGQIYQILQENLSDFGYFEKALRTYLG